MDVQVSSNFERLLFDILNQDDKKVTNLMSKLLHEGSFRLEQVQMEIIKKDFFAKKISDNETLEIIKNISEKHDVIIDPHTATAVGASKKINDKSKILVLATAHPYKFLETIKKATSKELKVPKQLEKISDKKEKYDILENKISDVKNYILKKIS